MFIRYYASTEQMDRPNNEDFFYADEKNHLYIVADGMGGTEGGEHASKFAALLAKTIVKNLGALAGKEPDETVSPDEKMFVYDYENALRHAFLETHEQTRKEGFKKALEDMGCTIVLLLFHGDRLFILNAGDCRCYLYNEGKLNQITRDQSGTAKRLREKEITPEEAKASRSGSVHRWVGGHKFSGGADTFVISYYINDRYIMCTDGVTKMLSDEEIESFVEKDDIKRSVLNMLAAIKKEPENPAAKRKRDNATVMIVEVAERSDAKDAAKELEKTARIKIEGFDKNDEDDDMDDED